MYNNSKLPITTEYSLRKLCANYPMHKELIDDALEEALEPIYRETMREDIGLYRGYNKSPLLGLISEKAYKEDKYRTKIMLCRRFNLPTSKGELNND